MILGERGKNICGCEAHAHTVALARREMPTDKTLFNVADLFKTFGDSTRIRILWALSEGELCVCDLADLLSMGQSAISHQLRVLRQARLVRCRREGKSMLYALDDSHVEQIIKLGLSHMKEAE